MQSSCRVVYLLFEILLLYCSSISGFCELRVWILDLFLALVLTRQTQTQTQTQPLSLPLILQDLHLPLP